LCAVGVAVVLPALTVWDAGVAMVDPDTVLVRALVIAAAAIAGVNVSAFFWWAVGDESTVLGMAGTALVVVLVLTTGSVLAGAVPAALLLATLVSTPFDEHHTPAPAAVAVAEPAARTARAALAKGMHPVRDRAHRMLRRSAGIATR
jgi:hypothetical protein